MSVSTCSLIYYGHYFLNDKPNLHELASWWLFNMGEILGELSLAQLKGGNGHLGLAVCSIYIKCSLQEIIKETYLVNNN